MLLYWVILKKSANKDVKYNVFFIRNVLCVENVLQYAASLLHMLVSICDNIGTTEMKGL